MKSKLIHLEDTVVETLTIQAVKNKTTFKEYTQVLLTEKAKQINKHLTKRLKDI